MTKPDTMLRTARILSKPSCAHGVGSFFRDLSAVEVRITYTASDKFYSIETKTKLLAWGPRRAVLPALAALIEGRPVLDGDGIVLLEGSAS